MNETGKALLEKRAAAMLIKYHGFVFRQARRFVPVASLAEDVAQQVLVDFLGKLGQWDLENDPKALLMAMTRRCAAAMWRERSKHLPETLRRIADLVRHEFAEENESLEEEDRQIEALQSCIRKLPETGRNLITLYYFDGVSTERLAEQLQKKSNTVARAIGRLREKLRLCIESSLKKEGDHA